MNLFRRSRRQVTEALIDRTCRVSVETDPKGLPATPILLDAEVEFDSGERDLARLALSIENAKALQHALLNAINEATDGQEDPA